MVSFPAYRRAAIDTSGVYNPFGPLEGYSNYAEDRSESNNVRILASLRVFNHAEAINGHRRNNTLSGRAYRHFSQVEAASEQSPIRNWFRLNEDYSNPVEDRNDDDYLRGFRARPYYNHTGAVNRRSRNVGPINRSYRYFNNAEDMNEQHPILNPFIPPPIREYSNDAEAELNPQVEVERHPFYPGGECFPDVEAMNEGSGGNTQASTETQPMANNADVGKAKLSEHECSICWANKFKNPVTTPCSHTFCHRCLLRWVRQGNLTCPMCRRVFEFSELIDMKIIRLLETPIDHRDHRGVRQQVGDTVNVQNEANEENETGDPRSGGGSILRRIRDAINPENEADEVRRQARQALARRLSPKRIVKRFIRACRDLINRH